MTFTSRVRALLRAALLLAVTLPLLGGLPTGRAAASTKSPAATVQWNALNQLGQATNTRPCAAGTDHGVAAAPGGARIRLCTVGGIIVNTTLARNLPRLLAVSVSAGLHLGGSGFRSYSQQIALRRANCGPTSYDIWHKPSGQCSPPTAIPGHSMHEWGLAIDFTNAGHTIRSHRDPAWRSLNVKAAGYGLHNLPSEPWHWSVNGK